MLELLIGRTSETGFTFDVQVLAEAAVVQWPDARIINPSGLRASLIQVGIEIPEPGNAYGPELTVDITGAGLGLYAPSRESAARVMAWIAQVSDLPTDGSVVVVHWTDDFYPLLPGATVETLMRDIEH